MRLILPPIVLALLASSGCREEVPDRIVVSGHVEATEVRVSTKIPGTLESVLFEEGDRVSRGQELARIDDVDQRLALDSARAEERQARAELRLRLAGARKEDVAEARAQIERATADLEGAERELERMEGLLASGSGTTKSRDDALTRRDVARATLGAAEERERKLVAGNRPEEIEQARARVQAAEARIAQVEQQIRDASITSPIDGVVTAKLAERGEVLGAGGGIALVTDLSGAWLNAYVEEPSLGRIRIGQTVEVVTDDGQTRKGEISFVASEAEFTPKNVQTRDERVKLVFRIKVRLFNDDHLFKPGMPAEVRIDPVLARGEEGGAT
jgi:HlyD family secretion protein